MKTEILVIGAGAAGIRAALSAAAEGAQVLLACERPPGESGSSFYPASPPWGMMFAQDEQDAEAPASPDAPQEDAPSASD